MAWLDFIQVLHFVSYQTRPPTRSGVIPEAGYTNLCIMKYKALTIIVPLVKPMLNPLTNSITEK